MRIMRVTDRDLPLTLVLEGERGAVEVYQLFVGKRKFGLGLNKVAEDLKRLILREADRCRD